jgi:hypothetical protein
MSILRISLPLALALGLCACSDDDVQNDNNLNRSDAGQNGNNSNCTGPPGYVYYYPESVEVDEASMIAEITGLLCPSAEVDGCARLPRSRIMHRVSTEVAEDGQMMATGPLNILSLTAVTVEDCSAFPAQMPEVCQLDPRFSCRFEVPGFSRFEIPIGHSHRFCCGDNYYPDGVVLLLQPEDATGITTELTLGTGGGWAPPGCGDGVCAVEEQNGACNTDCGCGNGIIDGHFEECDGRNLNGYFCEDSTKIPECGGCMIDLTVCD